MKNCIYGLLAGIVLFSCEKNDGNTLTKEVIYVPVFQKGDTVFNNNQITYQATEILFDSVSGQGFTLTSTHGSVPNQSSSYFIRFEINTQYSVYLLDTLTFSGPVFRAPILPTFKPGTAIPVDIENSATYRWSKDLPTLSNNSGWIKYHIFTSTQGGVQENISPGENFIVFKFGDGGQERLGWLNVVYQDTLAYVKEGYYTRDANQDIEVGQK